MVNFVKGRQLSELTGISASTFKAYRLGSKQRNTQPIWQEGIHWQRVNQRLTLYNLPLILDWIANRANPLEHQRAIETYLTSLPSNQPQKRGRRVG